MATLTLQPSDGDTNLRANDPDANFGTGSTHWIASTDSWATTKRVIIKFDASALPAGAVISSATLSMKVWSTPGGTRTYGCYRLTQTGWTESTATWNDYTTSTPWATAGGDYTATDKATTTAGVTVPGWDDWDILNQVEYAIDNTSGVVHCLIRDENEAEPPITYFYSSDEDGTAGDRPKLVIEYVVLTIPDTFAITASVLTPAGITDSEVLPDALAITAAVNPINVESAEALPDALAITAAVLAPAQVLGDNFRFSGILPALTLVANIPATMTLDQTLPALTLEATCKSGQLLQLNSTLPALTLTARMGIKASFILPALTLEATMTAGSVMRLNSPLPALTLEATATSGRLMQLNANLPSLALTASMLNGNVLSLNKTLAALTLIASAESGNSFTLNKDLPVLTLTSTMKSSNTMTLDKSLPALTLEAFADNYLDRYI